MALSPKKTKKLWIWKAFDRKSGRLIDWDCGARNVATLKRLMERLKQWKVTVFCTDKYKAYRKVINPKKLLQSKCHTVAIERNNARLRHWLGRFRRKSIIISKSIEMVDITLGLFARFHGPKTFPCQKELTLPLLLQSPQSPFRQPPHLLSLLC